jgi:hypothetical protein
MRADQRARRDTFLYKIGTRPVVMGLSRHRPFTGRPAKAVTLFAHQ